MLFSIVISQTKNCDPYPFSFSFVIRGIFFYFFYFAQWAPSFSTFHLIILFFLFSFLSTQNLPLHYFDLLCMNFQNLHDPHITVRFSKFLPTMIFVSFIKIAIMNLRISDSEKEFYSIASKLHVYSENSKFQFIRFWPQKLHF